MDQQNNNFENTETMRIYIEPLKIHKKNKKIHKKYKKNKKIHKKYKKNKKILKNTKI